MSLRKNITINKLPVQTPVQSPPTSPTSSTDKGIIFISDIKLDDNIKKTFKQFNKPIVEYNYNSFHNVKLQDIGLSYIWFNIRDPNCLQYLQRNIKQGTNYKKYIISNNLDNQWVTDIEQLVDKKIKLSKLKHHLIVLSYDDFKTNIDSVDISDVPDKLLSIFGYIKEKKVKKKLLKIIKSILTDDIPIHLIMLLLANTMPCLVGAVEVIQKIKQSNDIKNIILQAINTNDE